MEIFLDTANIKEIEKWLAQGVIDGVTTNPSIMLKDGVYDIEAGAKAIAARLGNLPLSVEVITNDLDEMLAQARTFAGWAKNMVVKIPVINESGAPCLGVVKTLESSGVRVNVTAMMSFGQMMLAAKAGATYISLFGGRVADEGQPMGDVIRMTRRWLDDWGLSSKIIVGSVREVMNIQEAAASGAHVVTIPPQFLARLADHKYTRFTVGEFVRDGQKALAELEALRRKI
jgi:transaldolase